MNNFNHPKISIIIRTFNEEKYLPECLNSLQTQSYSGEIETTIVDSGSTDETLEIARSYGCKIVEISKQRFTFGRSLNLGCKNSTGDIFVLVSAHCIPTNNDWLSQLVQPIISGRCEYTYGRQIPRNGVSKYSEGRVFGKYYPNVSVVPQEGYFCNNANSAIKRETWLKFRFNEALTGLEDMELAKRLIGAGGLIGYVGTSAVEHIHEESWKRIKIRFEREAVALSEIEPNLNLGILQASQMFCVALTSDFKSMNSFSVMQLIEIIKYRGCQFWGSFIGSRASKIRITRMKNEYFYPKISQNVVTIGDNDEHDRAPSHESS